MNSMQKDNNCQESMTSSNPSCLSGLDKFNNSDNQSSAKSSTTKLPPLMKVRTEDTSQTKENLKTTFTGLSMARKISDDSNIPSFKKIKTKKKIIQKKKKLVTPELQEKFNIYKQFVNLVNLSNNIDVKHEVQKKYILFVGKGNNSPLIRNIFRTYRPWWKIQQSNGSDPQINLHWHQLRQNIILQDMRQTKKTDQDFEHCNIFVSEKQQSDAQGKQQTQQLKKQQKRNGNNLRSHSVTIKDRDFSKNLTNTIKRSSSRIKSGSNEKNISPMKINLKKQIKQQKQIQNLGQKKKKILANPKMWPIYHNYRKLLNNYEMKQLKKLHILKQDGKIHGKLGRNKVKSMQNRSNSIIAHNHLCNNWNLSNKKALFMNLKNYYQSKKQNPFNNIPMTFHIKQKNDKQFQNFLEQYHKRNQQIKEEQKNKKNNANTQVKYTFKAKRRNAWLVKPGENTNRGNGIEVVQTLQQINGIIQKDTQGRSGQARTHIIQEYIIPFLYQKRKFDIRTYILITSINGCLKGYWYQDGYIRTSCKQFNMKNLANRFIHLTNDAVQKYHEDYGKYQPGNKLSYADFQRYLDSNNTQNGQKLKFWNQAYPEMKKLATDSIRSTYTKLDKNKKQFSFEIFGLDFLIDQNFKVWLIQANTNPCLQISCPLLGRIIPPMLQNAFKIVIDPIFPPPDIQQIALLTKKVMMPDNLIQNNKFQLIFDQAEQGKQLKILLRDAPQVKIFDIQQDQDQQFQDVEEPQQKNLKIKQTKKQNN